MKFEDILVGINGFGKFQVMIILLQSVSRITLPCNFLLNNFMAAVPDHRCHIRGLDDGDAFANLTLDQRLTVSIPTQEDGTLSSCRMFREPQFHLLHNSSNATEIPAVPCLYGWVYDNSTFSTTLATEWDLVCDRKGMNKATATIFFIGVMSGAAVFGTLSDRFGRKTMLLVAYLSSITFGLASAVSTSYVMFVIMRFFTGFSLTGISIISYVLSVEWFDVKHRTFGGIMVSLDWSVGNMMLSGIAYSVNNWRWLVVATTSPLILSVIIWWWLPESARWLMANGQVEKAHMYLEKCAKMNDRMEFMAALKPESLSNVEMLENRGKNYTFLDLVRTPNMRKVAICTGIVWFGVAFTYYGISLNVTGFGLNVYLTQFLYAAIEIPSKLMVYCSLNAIGRRPTQSATLLLTGLCMAVNLFTPAYLWIFRTVFAVLGKTFSETSFTTVFLYTAELYPTVVRQNGLGYTSFVARLGVSIAPLIALLDDVWRPLPEVMFCAAAVCSGLVACLLPETTNVRLPETIEDIEQPRSGCQTIKPERSDATLKPLTVGDEREC
ncbi:solute carrier family 22 member 7-like [Anguilla rostrata]|uniref:solute carrier family 22 member 7-like n=1 Tax=Anguilla rostrata TaxID=7938 RepID=UPI0030CF0EDA